MENVRRHKRPQRKPDHGHRGGQKPRPPAETAPSTAKETYLIPRASGGSIPCCLVFPNTYFVGMSNLGFQTVYALLNTLPGVYCERAFLPPALTAERLPQKLDGIATLESRRGIHEFQFIGFSLSFELDLPNVLRVLHLAGIPLETAQREERHPIVFGGGALTLMNPEPIAEFMDFLVLGEAEVTLREVFEVVAGMEKRTRGELLKALTKIPGVYVPSIHGPARRQERHRQSAPPEGEGEQKETLPLHRRIMRELDFSTHSVILTPDTEFSNTFLLEISRGCPHMCSFCMVCHSYAPYRWRTQEDLLPAIELGLQHTKRFGLIGADLSTYPHIEDLLDRLSGMGIVPSFSSLRAQALSPRIIQALVAGKQETLTLAPETSERLRLRINKRFSDTILLKATERALEAGLKNLRYYFMLGLPGEEDADVVDIIRLVQGIAHLQERRGVPGSTVTLNFNQFVPKANTPFERAGFAQAKEVDDRLNRIRNSLRRLRNVQIKGESTRMSYMQGLFSMGDRAMGKVLRRIYLDTSGSNLKKILKEEIPGEDRFLFEGRQARVLPWSHLATPAGACPRERPLEGLGFKMVRRGESLHGAPAPTYDENGIEIPVDVRAMLAAPPPAEPAGEPRAAEQAPGDAAASFPVQKQASGDAAGATPVQEPAGDAAQ